MLDLPWISSLRFNDPSSSLSLQSGLKLAKRETPTNTVPDKVPPFFETDMAHWREKFQKHIRERQQYKKVTMTNSEFYISPTRNSNANTHGTVSPPQRRVSRQSAETFCNIDFDCIGNTNYVLIFYLVNISINR